jgi:hypothetical protein
MTIGANDHGMAEPRPQVGVPVIVFKALLGMFRQRTFLTPFWTLCRQPVPG